MPGYSLSGFWTFI